MGGAPPNEITTDAKGVVTDVTPGFLTFTGYQETEMVGRKCNFLQGEGTDPGDVDELRLAMKNEGRTSVVILNYCKDGTPFWNILTISPEFKKGTHELKEYHGEVIGLPVPPYMQHRPRLCLDDALALISVFSSVPRALEFHDSSKFSVDKDVLDMLATSKTDAEKVESSPPTPPSPSLYQHVNYGKRFEGGKDGQSDSGNTSDYYFVAETSLPTDKGRFRVRAYRNELTGAEPLAMINGKVEGKSDVIVRVHDQCVTSEVFGSLRCDCKQQLDFALNYIQETEGILLYLPQEGRGIGLANKVAAYAAQETGLDTVDANRHLGLPDDAREYDSVRDILKDMNIKSIKILTNNPRKIDLLTKLGVEVSERLECVIVPNSDYSMNYVHAKAARMGHMINLKSLSSNFTKSKTQT
eukprot:CAMPEP_0203801014 /NCGR_PEP_ID=MMETSP0100_2-20121128/10979_1 /ASSEMBLY_ACC=CAM_ASM_000210 /TAXON_ID=96639 /ORGANISM=" , Strain NY0313808BC1" /LENGTH=411 /DNA_ID=CAMNT_0050707445 /DNA_START=111 /DNA_END=1346 /DNA_ORIENTATION=-